MPERIRMRRHPADRPRFQHTMRLAHAAILFIGLCGCQAVPPIQTPSGRPECFIDGIEPAPVQAYCVERMIANGAVLQQQTPSQLVFWVENDNMMANTLLGSQYDPTTTHEYRFIFSPVRGGTQVYGQIALLTNEGSAFERRTDLTSGQAGYDMWQALVRIREHFYPPAPTAPAESPHQVGVQ